MTWYQNIIRKQPAPPPGPPKHKDKDQETKGPLSFLHKEWEDPAFVKKMRNVASSLVKGGVAAPDKPEEKAAAGKDKAPEIPKELADSPEAKGAMSYFYRKWKDPAFLKQMKVLAAHMQKDGVDIKNKNAVQAWVEKNKTAIEKGEFKEDPAAAVKVETFQKTTPDVGRNAPCPCGSKKKFKKCCANK